MLTINLKKSLNEFEARAVIRETFPDVYEAEDFSLAPDGENGAWWFGTRDRSGYVHTDGAIEGMY